MGDLLDREKLTESFRAVQSFLQAAQLNTMKHHLDLLLNVNAKRQNFKGSFEIECKDRLDNESFVIYSDVFKANGYYRPVWSAYVYMTFDDSNGELEFELEGVKYTLKH
ncbi:MAG: hypothetical protein EAZ75_10145 [Flavobacteriia bacterium]|nr:MAG: hypothetical protein EAZ75_10145 [Flavobacteriia bacterium]